MSGRHLTLLVTLLMLGGFDSPLLIGPAQAALSAGRFSF